MMGLTVIRYDGAVPGNITKRNFNNEILKPSYKKLGEWFHRERVPIRFKNEAKRLLKLTPRTGEDGSVGPKAFKQTYTGRKFSQKKHVRPFVWSGESEALATKIRDIRATSKGVRIVLHARKLNLRHPRSKIKMNEEIRRVAPSEIPEIKKVFETEIQRRINSFKAKRVVKV